MTIIIDKLIIEFILILVINFSSCTTFADITLVKKIIIDTDTGADDATALVMLTEAQNLGEGIEIIAITCVNGNTYVKNVGFNVLKTLKVLGRLDIPVYLGAEIPLLLPAETDNYFGKDGFGDFYYPDPPSMNLLKTEHAVITMINLVRQYPGQVTLLALGPLTNIAMAIRLYPPFMSEIQQLIIMGGTFDGRGNIRPNIEFNFFVDPTAAFIVFNSSIFKPHVVPYDTTVGRVKITRDFRNSLSRLNNSKSWLLDSAERLIVDENDGYWYCADAVAAAVAITSGSIITKEKSYRTKIVYTGDEIAGMILVDYENITRNAANTNMIQSINEEIFQQMIYKYFSH